MPELPEVETIRRSLLPAVTGLRISRVLIETPGVFALDEAEAVTGLTIRDIKRRGKYLLFYLQDDGTAAACWLLVHLRMTGRLLVQATDAPIKRHTHVRLILTTEHNHETALVFQDTRRFGRLWLCPADSPDLLPDELSRLGPEPLDPPLTAAELTGQLRRHQRLTLKAALLNQSIVAGIGNIYADEILFAAGLAPQQQVATLTPAQTEQLAAAIPAVLTKAIELCGTTLRDYVDGWSREGRFQDCLTVYGRAGLPCRTCGRQLQKGQLAGRTTTWCPVCQQADAR